VHYERWNRFYDEFISEGNERIAPAGLYTSWADIPRYENWSNNDLVGHVVDGVVNPVP